MTNSDLTLRGGITQKHHRVRFIVFRYGHHSPHSGYARTAEFGAKAFNGEIIQVNKPLSRHIVRERMLWWLAKGTPGYDRAAMAAELSVAWRMLREKDYIYHFLYGETNYHYVGQLNNFKQNRIIATFHLPPDRLSKIVQIDWHLRQLSAVVCVGRNQQDFFARIMDPNRVFYVPLGIDTDYYTPPDNFEDRDPDLCLLVGNNYRDYPTFRGVIELVAYQRPSTKFVVVTLRENYNQIGNHPNLTLQSNIPEAEFLALYRRASLMVMPLHDATANNAVLESLACGLPLVITDVGATRDYVNPESAVLLPPYDSQLMAKTVLHLLNDPDRRKEMSVQARAQALRYSWPTVINMLDEVYSAVS
jgi:glycosyltransferase involved in cell wall biosynthesis